MSSPAQGTAGEIVMPRLSDTMEEGTILRWLKADGDAVERGEELVEIETDKATMVYESDVAGTLTLLAGEGETLPVGQPIARVSGEDAARSETGDGPREPPAPPGAPEPASSVPLPPPAAPPEPASSVPLPPPAAPPEPASSMPLPPPAAAPTAGAPASAPNGAPASAAAPQGRVKASPLARRIARLRGIDLATVSGTGPGGRIVKADLAAGQEPPAGAPTPAASVPAGAPAARDAAPHAEQGAPAPGAAGPEAVATAKGETTEVELNRLQQAVARRMAEAKATIPEFTIALDVDMEECVALRTELKRLAADGSESAPTYNDMVVKACALALREHPKANASYRDGKLLLHSRVNVGVAVAAEGALVVPTVFDADKKALGEIARETRALAGRVREGAITPPELGGGTFTVSNLGMFGIRSFTPIINPPQAAILSVGALERRAAVGEDGGIKPVRMLTLTLVCDHRIVFGAEAAQFLARVRDLLRAPAALTL